MGYIEPMTKKPHYPVPPASAMNQWVRDAIASAGITQQELAERLSGFDGLGNYAKSMVNKMTKARKVTMDEARAISEITGHPLPPTTEAVEIVAEIDALAPRDRAAIVTLIRNLARRKPGDEQ